MEAWASEVSRRRRRRRCRSARASRGCRPGRRRARSPAARSAAPPPRPSAARAPGRCRTPPAKPCNSGRYCSVSKRCMYGQELAVALPNRPCSCSCTDTSAAPPRKSSAMPVIAGCRHNGLKGGTQPKRECRPSPPGWLPGWRAACAARRTAARAPPTRPRPWGAAHSARMSARRGHSKACPSILMQ